MLGEIALRRMAARVRASLDPLRGLPPRPPHADALAKNNAIIAAAARACGVTSEPIGYGTLRLTYNGRTTLCRGAEFSFETLIAHSLCANKPLTSRILADNGLPVPDFACFTLDRYAEATTHFQRLGEAVVVKPAIDGTGGAGVTVGVSTRRAFRKAFIRARMHSHEVMIEPVVPGFAHRLSVLDGRVLSVMRGVPAHVIGDGRRAIVDLINERNLALSDTNDAIGQFCPIPVDRETKAMLAKAGCDLRSVPEPGRHVSLQSTSNIDRGGVAEDVTAQTHPAYFAMAIQAAHVMSSTLCGVDIIVEDIALPPDRCQPAINDVNTTPGLYGVSADVGEQILRRLLGTDTAPAPHWSDRHRNEAAPL